MQHLASERAALAAGEFARTGSSFAMAKRKAGSYWNEDEGKRSSPGVRRCGGYVWQWVWEALGGGGCLPDLEHATWGKEGERAKEGRMKGGVGAWGLMSDGARPWRSQRTRRQRRLDVVQLLAPWHLAHGHAGLGECDGSVRGVCAVAHSACAAQLVGSNLLKTQDSRVNCKHEQRSPLPAPP